MYQNASEPLKAHARQVARGDIVVQRQDSLIDQLDDLYILANRFGMYDAADYLRDLIEVRIAYCEMPS